MNTKAPKLRGWQEKGLKKLKQKVDDGSTVLSVVAPPGAGKSHFGCKAFKTFREDGLVERLVWLSPSRTIKNGIASSAAAWDLQIAIDMDNSSMTRVSDRQKGFDGSSQTYAQVSKASDLHRYLNSKMKTMVIFDEFHHLGTESFWGETFEYATDPCVLKLGFSATPYRSGPYGIPLLEYDSEGKLKADYHHTIKEALKVRDIRPFEFVLENGRMDWTDDGIYRQVTFQDNVNKRDTSTRLRAAIYGENYCLGLLEKAHKTLQDDRKHFYPNAKGIVFADSVQHINTSASLLKRITGKTPAIVHNKVDNAQDVINHFAESKELDWIVSCRMIGEGANIPELTTCVYLSKIKTPLSLHQAWGRCSRQIEGFENLNAHIFLPEDPDMKAFASQIEIEQREAFDELGEEPEAGGQKTPIENERNITLIGAECLGASAISSGKSVSIAAMQQAQSMRTLHPELRDQHVTDVQVAVVLQTLNDNGDLVLESSTKPQALSLEEQIKSKRKRVSDLAPKVAYKLGVHAKDVHQQYIRITGKRNKDMGLAELEQKEAWMIKQLANIG